MADRAPKKTRRRWSTAQKQALLQRARQLVADGATWDQAAEQVDVWPSSLTRWSMQFPAKTGFKPVVVEPTAPAVSVSSAIVITTPQGLRIEGLDADGAYLILEALQCSA